MGEPALDLTDPLADDGDAQPSQPGSLDLSDPLAGDAGHDLVTSAQHEVAGDFGDAALGVLDGLVMNYGGELGELGEGLGNLASGPVSRLMGTPVPDASFHADGVNPVDEAMQTSVGKYGNMAGNIASGVALSAVTGGLGGIGRQAAIQGGAGAFAGFGREHDPMDALVGGAVGGALGGGGRYLAGKYAPRPSINPEVPPVHASGEWQPPTMDGDIIPTRLVGPEAEIPQLVSANKASMAGPMENVIEAPPAAPWSSHGALSPAELTFVQKMTSGAVGTAASMAGGRPAGWAAQQLVQNAMKAAPGKVGQMRDPMTVMKAAGGVAGASRALVAGPDIPTITWSMQSLNAGGDTGLPPDAQAQLDEALMAGDNGKVAATYMQLSMKYPAFQKRIQKELESIHSGD